jgi:hypothetical protein
LGANSNLKAHSGEVYERCAMKSALFYGCTTLEKQQYDVFIFEQCLNRYHVFGDASTESLAMHMDL